MSIFTDQCDEQYLSIEQLLILLIYCNDDGNHYVNVCNSDFSPEGLLQVACNQQFPIKSLLKQVVNEDADGNPCVSFVSTDNTVFFCSNELDFQFECNSQYLIAV